MTFGAMLVTGKVETNFSLTALFLVMAVIGKTVSL